MELLNNQKKEHTEEELSCIPQLNKSDIPEENKDDEVTKENNLAEAAIAGAVAGGVAGAVTNANQKDNSEKIVSGDIDTLMAILKQLDTQGLKKVLDGMELEIKISFKSNEKNEG